jgi:secreted trypsin-like serine protease
VNGKATLVGVTSFGYSCNPGIPSVYFRVSSQKSWILANTDAASFPCGSQSNTDYFNWDIINIAVFLM